jgi:competence protein ComEA
VKRIRSGFVLNNKKMIVILLIGVIVCGIGYVVRIYPAEYITVERENSTIQKQPTIEKTNLVETSKVLEQTQQPTIKQKFKIYVCGEVNKSGVVTIESGSRIIDAVELAGGTTSLADLNKVNLAEFVCDAQKIYIPKIGEDVDKNEIIAQNSSVKQNNSKHNLININTADKATLEQLTGIGETIAQNIIEYRQLNGGFKSIDEIKKVSRIGEKTFEKIKDKITVGN